MEFVDRLKKHREFRDVKVSPLLVLARAVMLAMRRTPEINSWLGRRRPGGRLQALRQPRHRRRHPARAGRPQRQGRRALSLLDLAAALNALTATAREGKTQPAEMSGGTFTITNVGVFGVDAGTPIINPGESAILASARSSRSRGWSPTADGRAIESAQVTTLALTFDHRHIDGEKGSRFLADVAGDPGRPLQRARLGLSRVPAPAAEPTGVVFPEVDGRR